MTDDRYDGGELDFDTVEDMGLDGTGRDGNPFFPYTRANVDMAKRWNKVHGRREQS